MMHRLLTYAQLRRGTINEFKQIVKKEAVVLQEKWAVAGLSHVAVFCCDRHVCVYAEAAGDRSTTQWDWPVSFERYLEKWPTEPDQEGSSSQPLHRLSIPMIDVFHDGLPMDCDSWQSGREIEERVGSIARLKPEMVSSYIFYHYQKQEESPDNFNSSYMIGSFGRILFSYYELPSRISSIKRQGLLTTKNSPDHWHESMYPHFEPWEDALEGQQLWRKMTRLL